MVVGAEHVEARTMSKPDITLEPSKGVVSMMAAQIFSAHIIRGNVQEGNEDQYMERSIREAIRIAKTVERSVETEDVPATKNDPHNPSSEASSPSVSAEPTNMPTSASTAEKSGARSELDAVIQEVLSGEDTSAVGKKGQ
jgi:hypothetical protein